MHRHLGLTWASWFVAIGLAPTASPAIVSAQDECTRVGIEEDLYYSLLRRNLAALVSPHSSGVPGSFAAVDVKEAEATLGFTTILGSGNVLGIKVNGGSAAGLLPVFSGHELNPKFGASIQVHFMNPSGHFLRYDHHACLQYHTARRRIEREYAHRSAEATEEYRAALKILALAQLDKKAEDVKKAISEAPAGTPRRDSLLVELRKVELTRASTSKEPISSTAVQQVAVNNWRNEEIAKLADIDVRGFSLGWWSLGYGITNTTFRLFDASAAFDVQVAKHDALSHTATLQYSHYTISSAAFETRFWSAFARYSLGDNLNELTKVELVERKSYSNTPNERVAEKKYTAYQGEYQEYGGSLDLGADFYQFLFHENRAAVHLYPAMGFRKDLKTSVNFGVGVLLVARNATKEKSDLNAELYFNFVDLWNARDADKDLIGRSGLGFRLTFPITFRSGI